MFLELDRFSGKSEKNGNGFLMPLLNLKVCKKEKKEKKTNKKNK